MAHQFKVGDRVRLKDSERNFAETWGLTGTLVFSGINCNGNACFKGTTMVANVAHLEPVPAPALIDAAKTYTTRNGRAVRIYATDGESEYPIHGAIDKEGWKSAEWTATGAFYADETEEFGDDLIEVKPEREGWINVYQLPTGNFYSSASADTKQEADQNSTDRRIACLHVKFREGDGL